MLDQRERDVLGLALIALGVFMGFVIYGGWQGGSVGHGVAVALAFSIGRARGLAPVAMIAGGVVLLCAPLMPARPLRAGSLSLSCAILLALCSGTFGVSAGQAGAGSRWSASFLEHRGGLFGQALYTAARYLVQQVGVDVLIGFLLVLGTVLLTGASIATVLRATGGGLADTTRLLRSKLGPAASDREDGLEAMPQREAAFQSSIAAAAEADLGGGLGGFDLMAQRAGGDEGMERDHVGSDLEPPDLDPQKLVVRATHVEAPSMDGRLYSQPLAAGAGEPPAGLAGARERSGERGEDRDGGWESETAGASAGALALRERGEEAGGEQDAGGSGEPRKRRADGSRADPAGEIRATRGQGEAGDSEALTPQGRLRAIVTDDPEFVWKLPPTEGILARSGTSSAPDLEGQRRVASALVETLGHFGVQAKIVGTVSGPHITRYELRLAPGIKVAKVAHLKDDLAYALAATDIRILAPIPGKQAVGVEVPNAKRRIVRLGDVFQQPPPSWSPLTVWLGKDIAGKAIGADLAKMPHLLVAGTTGAGKSAAINAMLSSVLLRASPKDVRLVLIDPKQVELNHYESIPHLITPVITNPKMAANALGNLVKEMERRYGIMSLARTRSLDELNRARGKRGEGPLPYILCVIDELADLMMVAPADVEDSIIRLAQKARAVGMHLVLATQSPRVDVITGMIKANVPSRIAFAVSSQTDSRVILDQNGAESLLGQGDMLFSPLGSSKLQRIQGAYIDEEQIAKLTDFWRDQGEPDMREELLEEVEGDADGSEGSDGDELSPDEDPLLADAITLVAEMQTASTSMLQRRLRLGYTRAGRLIDMLERRGVISGYEGSKPRQVLISEAEVPRVLAMLEHRARPVATAAARESSTVAPDPSTPAADASGDRPGSAVVDGDVDAGLGEDPVEDGLGEGLEEESVGVVLEEGAQDGAFGGGQLSGSGLDGGEQEPPRGDGEGGQATSL